MRINSKRGQGGHVLALAGAGAMMIGLAALSGPVNADPVSVTSRPAPEIAAGTWVNGAPTTIAAQRGKVVALLFWTHGCINCKHNLPYWNDWAKRYKGSDVTVLSVHTPEGEWERDPAGVRAFVKEHGLRFPVVTDNASATWNAYGVQAWPTEVLIDKHGRIRYEFDGELNWEGSAEYVTVQGLIEQLRKES